MTVVCFDGKMIAADGMRLFGDMICSTKIKKLTIIGDKCVAGAGDAFDIEAFKHWCERGMRDDHVLSLRDENFSALVISADGSAKYFHKGYTFGLDEEIPTAIGAGSIYALAAMKAGADARRAVEIACELDPGCGGEIQVIMLDELKKKSAEIINFDPKAIDRAACQEDGIQFPRISAIIDRMKKNDEDEPEARVL
jgi:ATP-dependent protease HslVU (ClpYQ) peptidase subunit